MVMKRKVVAIVVALAAAGALAGGVAYGAGGQDEGTGTEIEQGIEGPNDDEGQEADDGPNED